MVNADLANYSGALGAAQMLPDGNLAFTSGFHRHPATSGSPSRCSPMAP